MDIKTPRGRESLKAEYYANRLRDYLRTNTNDYPLFLNPGNTIDLSTDWMTEEMATYFTELISSPYTYFKVSNYDESCGS